MAHRIGLVTDSTCDLPEDWLKQYDIQVTPLTIIFGDEQFRDGVDLTPAQFYERLSRDRQHPTTSQPAPEAFLEAYRRAVANGADEILVITLSAAMSGTIESARRAAQEAGCPVTVVDGKNNSMGLGWQVIAAARAQAAAAAENTAEASTQPAAENTAGGGLAAMLAAAQQVREDMVYNISLDTIEYLSRGGRISDAARFLDSLLKIKPLIYVRPETGTVGASIPGRSRKSALEGLYKEFFRHINTARPMHITVLHNDALPEAEEIAERVRQEYAPQELLIRIVSPVLGVHTGPRAVALCGYAER